MEGVATGEVAHVHYGGVEITVKYTRNVENCF